MRFLLSAALAGVLCADCATGQTLERLGSKSSPAVSLLVLAAIIILVVWKPQVGLIIAGILATVFGVISFSLSGALGPTIGIYSIIGGLVLIGFGRLIGIVEDILKEATLLRIHFEGRLPPITDRKRDQSPP